MSSSCSEYSCTSKNLVLHVLDASFLITILVIQGSILNYYIIAHFSHSVNPYFWFIADFSCLFVFAGALAISYQYLQKNSTEQNTWSQKWNPCFGALPLSYLSWLLYSGILLGKIVMIFKSEIPDYLSSKDFFGTQFLQGTIALSGLVFFLLAEGHDGAQRHTPRHLYVTSICGKTGIELLDVVSFLALLLVNETHFTLTYGLENAILILCCIDLLLPAFALYKLSLSDVAQEKFLLPTAILYNLLHLLLVDVPFLGIRLYLWMYYASSASMFVMKNVFRIFCTLRGMYPDLRDLAKRYCKARPKEPSVVNGVRVKGDGDSLELTPMNKQSEAENV